MSTQDKIQQLMEDRGWTYEEDEPALKFAANGAEIAREGDAEWEADLAIVRSIM